MQQIMRPSVTKASIKPCIRSRVFRIAWSWKVLAEAIERKYRVVLESIWSKDLTLGGLFAFVRWASQPR